jgi:hypothetical protein
MELWLLRMLLKESSIKVIIWSSFCIIVIVITGISIMKYIVLGLIYISWAL